MVREGPVNPCLKIRIFQHIEFEDLVVHNKDNPRSDVFYYNKPHDQFCFAHITMLEKRWHPHDYQFHVTVYVPDEPQDPNRMELVYQKTEHVDYRAVKVQQQWIFDTLPPRTVLASNTLTCAQTYAEAFISYLNEQFRQYHGGRKCTGTRRKSSRRSTSTLEKRREAGQKSGAKSIASPTRAAVNPVNMTSSSQPDYATQFLLLSPHAQTLCLRH